MIFPDFFVGRNRELENLRNRLHALSCGASFVVAVAGESGVGKTTFTSAVLQLSQSANVVGIRSTSVAHGGTPPYWLWQSVLDKLGISNPLDFEDADAALLDPTTRARREFVAFESIAAAVRKVAAERPILIVLEDLNWADEDSLRLLAHIAPGLEGAAVGLIVTYRQQLEDVSVVSKQALLSLMRTADSELIMLESFTEAETRDLVGRLEKASGQDIPWADVFERSGGNPLFVSELGLMASLSSNGELSSTLRLAVEYRLNLLKPRTIELLELCSLASREIRRSTISIVANSGDSWSLQEIAESIDEAVQQKFLSEDPELDGSYSFRHPVVREVIASRIGKHRKSQIHTRYLDALETEFENSLQEQSEVLVFHAEHARPLIEVQRLVRLLILAAREAMKTFSVERAAIHYTRVIEISGSEMVDESLAEAMRGIVVAGSGTDRDSEIAQYFERSFRYYVGAGMIDLALEIAQLRFIDTVGMSQGIEVYEAALELAEPDSKIEANILGRLGRSVGMVRGDYSRAQSLLESGIRIAQQLGDANLEMQLSGDGVNVAAFNGEYLDSRSYCVRIEQLAKVTSDSLSESGAYLHLGIFDMALGETARGIEYLTRSLAQSIESHINERISSSHKVLISAFIKVCDWESAREHVQLALQLFPTDDRVLGLSVVIESMTGNAEAYTDAFSGFMATAEQRRDSGEGSSTRHLIMAYRANETAELFKEVERSISAIELRTQSTSQLSVGALLARACLALDGRSDDYQQLREQLIQERLQVLELPYLPGVTSLAGLKKEADDEFEQAISLATESGQLFTESWLRFDLAAHLVRHSYGETAIAQAISSGRRTATRGGIVALNERFDSLELQAAGRKKRTAGLTSRELEILRLMYSGKSNPEIAEELVLSRHTVVRHLSNVFSKLDVSNRTEASKAAVELGLV